MNTKVKVAGAVIVGFALVSIGEGIGSTKTVTHTVNHTTTVSVPGPTVNHDVPGPVVHELPAGCGAALANYEKVDVATVSAAVDPSVDAATFNNVNIPAWNAADAAAAAACFPTTSN